MNRLRNVRARIPIARATYYYAWGRHPDTNNGHVVGPFETKEKALDETGTLGDVRTFALQTRDHSKATKIIKAKMLGTDGARAALQRVGHKFIRGNDFGADDNGKDDKDDDDI